MGLHFRPSVGMGRFGWSNFLRDLVKVIKLSVGDKGFIQLSAGAGGIDYNFCLCG